MKYPVFKTWLCACLLLCLTPDENVAQGADHEHLHSLINARLQQSGGDTASFYIIEAVRKKCGKDEKCMKGQLNSAAESLEQHGKYQVAIPLAEELVKLAQSEDDLPVETAAMETLVRLYNFIEYTRQEILTREKLIQLYEKMGNQEGAISNKAIILEGKAWNLNDPSTAIAAIEALMEQAIRHNLTGTANKIRIRLKYLYEEFGYFEKLSGIVTALEKIPVSDPLQPSEATYAFHAASGRADLLLREKRFELAESLYQKALRISQLRYRKQHDAWSEIYILQRLGRLETERKSFMQAHAYLDEALEKAKALNMTDQLEVNYKWRAKLAEAEHQFADALFYTRKFYEYRDRVDSLSPGFDIQKYYLELEGKQLKLESERQSLSLELTSLQLRYSIIIGVMALFSAAGLFIGLNKQRKGKQQISHQYALIQQQAEELRQLDAAKSRFFANVSHELRTPLSLVTGPIHTLLKGNTTPEKQENLMAMANRGAKDLRHLVDEILDLGKMEAGKMAVSPEATPVASFFQRCCSQFESLAERNGADYRFHINVEKEVAVQLDREKCRQIIFNLLSNAFKFTPAGGRVKVDIGILGYRDTEQRAGNTLISQYPNIVISVADTGKGIHPDDLPHVFDRYFQSNRPDAIASGGTGIGLAICQEYARLLGGSIAVQSTLGKGSRFEVSLPAAKAATPLDSEPPAERMALQPEEQGMARNPATLAPTANVERSTRPLLLVVEDTPDLQAYIRTILEDSYEVVTARNGREALDLIWDGERGMKKESRDEGRGMRDVTRDSLIPRPSSLIPDLIISDLMMPEMDGYQLLTALKNNEATQSIPVIMLTARADRADRLKALRIGVDDYLTKPFDEEELLVRIENLLANQAVRKVAAAEEQPAAEAPEMSQPDKEWLENFESYIQDKLSNDALTISFLAQEFAMSDSTLFRQVSRLTGLSPKQYLQEIRLDAARQLLEDRAYRTVARVAAEAGFSNAGTFSRSFSKRFGKSPSEYLND
ncbi:MAG: response regulator [Saprospiraceae bacterium]|nr:response regulator [Saprospiraceae bacterium]MCF8252861.1 response regulator [Saprospiraceae bacterium]MCF8283322.1 response regulator [Bacteroidales bacterium]MCF8314414.1 response regulator [Saprospiraceae bacterium]MCF8443304.1 response regulator [Saprospiraceae bacterium]